jgi:hypothetical protein
VDRARLKPKPHGNRGISCLRLAKDDDSVVELNTLKGRMFWRLW